MLFNSIDFLIFFPLVCLAYYIIPAGGRHLFLLIVSYYFYMCWNPEYVLLLLAITVLTYVVGLLLGRGASNAPGNSRRDRRRRSAGSSHYGEETAEDESEESEGAGARKRRAARRSKTDRPRNGLRKLLVFLAFAGCLGCLGYFKYFNFLLATGARMLQLFDIQTEAAVYDIVLPVGISFYTFEALGYVVDVYRDRGKAEHNFFSYALFLSFFPNLVSGPIERSGNLLAQIHEKQRFDFERVRDGMLLMLYGYFQKVVLCEYLAVVVDNVYDTYLERTGFQLLVATLCYALQIYCDFGSYSNLARGAAQILGFRLTDNFNTPYFAVSVADFWRRWHISLSSWFRDYLYIPLGGNRRGKVRKYLNVMIVFMVSGLWHGASGHYVLWGFLNGAYQVIGAILKPLRKKVMQLTRVNEQAASHKLLQMILTFGLVDISWVFFRATFAQGIEILKRIAGLAEGCWFTWGDNLDAMGLTLQTRNLLVVSVALLLLADICKYRGIDLIAWIGRQGLWLRWLIYYGAIFGILIFGMYGPGYDASQFIYSQF